MSHYRQLRSCIVWVFDFSHFLIHKDRATVQWRPHSRKKNGEWSSRAVTTSEAGKWLRHILNRMDGKSSYITAHTLKGTPLSWCATFGLDPGTRLLLGHHSTGKVSAECYGRDNLAKPLREFDVVLQQIPTKAFMPDSTRSDMMRAPQRKLCHVACMTFHSKWKETILLNQEYSVAQLTRNGSASKTSFGFSDQSRNLHCFASTKEWVPIFGNCTRGPATKVIHAPVAIPCHLLISVNFTVCLARVGKFPEHKLGTTPLSQWHSFWKMLKHNLIQILVCNPWKQGSGQHRQLHTRWLRCHTHQVESIICHRIPKTLAPIRHRSLRF